MVPEVPGVAAFQPALATVITMEADAVCVKTLSWPSTPLASVAVPAVVKNELVVDRLAAAALAKDSLELFSGVNISLV